ncbi:hypothetical protein FE782_00330 [Paenibacillus antri]|uniref:Uncharacterized protein n=1 Tax=Paenibacillus antri TaxID=2582848 RepID=A0A5R9GL83_9BACL|nr:hypothetical protein [Paenibacillus antri]TLS53843.1 hypothetical protein FE782_00330 [Paenibacillus antri]
MSLAVLSLMAWFVMIVFAFIPKRLTLTELVFLYFVIVVLTISLFTTLDVNLNWAPLTRKIDGAFAMYICRFIVIPFLVLMAVCALLSHLKAKWRVALSAIIVMVLCGADQVYLLLGLMEFARWNVGYSLLMYGLFVLSVWWIARWFIGLDKEVSGKS